MHFPRQLWKGPVRRTLTNPRYTCLRNDCITRFNKKQIDKSQIMNLFEKWLHHKGTLDNLHINCKIEQILQNNKVPWNDTKNRRALKLNYKPNITFILNNILYLENEDTTIPTPVWGTYIRTDTPIPWQLVCT